MLRKKNDKLVNIKNGHRSKIFARAKTMKSATSKLANYRANIKMIYKEDIIEAKPFLETSSQSRERLEAKYAKYAKY